MKEGWAVQSVDRRDSQEFCTKRVVQAALKLRGAA